MNRLAQQSGTLLLAGLLSCYASVAASAQTASSERNSPSITWTPKWTDSQHRPGYPLLEDVAHFSIQMPSIEAGAYHNHPQLIHFQKRFYACWNSHKLGENGPGQRVLFSHSIDGMKWEKPAELFPPMDHSDVSTKQGRVVTAFGFFTARGRLYAVGDAHFSTQQADDSPTLQRLGRLIRDATNVEELGTIQWLDPDRPDATDGFRDYPVATANRLPALPNIQRILATSTSAHTLNHNASKGQKQPDVMLVEPTTYQAKSQQFVRLWRAQDRSFRMFAQLSDDGKQWGPAFPTPIPDAPAKTVTQQLDSGETLLIGNQVFTQRGTRRDPLTIAISKNGFDFDRAYAIRWRTPPFRTPRQQTEPDGRGRGFQCPNAAVVNDEAGKTLWVIYSVNKESIEVSRIDLDSLLDFSPCGFFGNACIERVIAQSAAEHRGVQFDQDAVLLGATTQRNPDGSYWLKMAWQLKQGRRPNRFIHICDAQGKILRQGDRNADLFDSETGNRTVFDGVRLTADELKSAASVGIGFYGPERKSSPIKNPNQETAGKNKFRLTVLQLDAVLTTAANGS